MTFPLYASIITFTEFLIYLRLLLELMSPYLSDGDIIDTITFIPKDIPGKSINPKYENMLCNGLEIRKLKRPIFWTINLLKKISLTYPENFSFLPSNFIDKLYGDDNLRLIISNLNASTNDLFEDWKEDHHDFINMSKKYYLY